MPSPINGTADPFTTRHVGKLPKRIPTGNRSPVKPNGRQGVCTVHPLAMKIGMVHFSKMGAAYWGMWADSKSVNCGFESHHLCKARPYNLAGVDRANTVACDGKDCAHWP